MHLFRQIKNIYLLKSRDFVTWPLQRPHAMVQVKRPRGDGLKLLEITGYWKEWDKIDTWSILQLKWSSNVLLGSSRVTIKQI